MSDRGHRQGAEAGLSESKRSALAVTTIDESCDSYRSYDTNSERGSGNSGISGEKSRPSSRSFRLHRISARPTFAEAAARQARRRDRSVLPQKSREIRASQDLQCDLFRRLGNGCLRGGTGKGRRRFNCGLRMGFPNLLQMVSLCRDMRFCARQADCGMGSCPKPKVQGPKSFALRLCILASLR